MFDSLKNKLKGLFKKAPKEVAEPDAEPVPEEPKVEVPKQEPIVETPKEVPVQEPKAEPKEVPAEPAKREEPKAEVPKVEPVAETPKAEPAVKEEPKTEPKAEVPKAEPAVKKEPAKAKEEPVHAEPKKSYIPSEAPKEAGLTDSWFGGKKIKEEELEDLLWELEISLLEADVALPVVDEIKEGVKQNLLGRKYGRGHTLEQVVELSLKDAVRNILKNNVFDFDDWVKQQPRPTSIMFVGINGTGKTTAIAKVANRLMKDKYSVVLAAGDTFRAGAIEQLNIHADKLGCKIIKHSQEADPAAVAYDAIDHAKSKNKDIVLIDTAGRMQTNNNLINEMKKIVKVAKPALKVFVGDSLAGNNAVEQAKVFDDAIGIDAVILTKIDTDTKGGAALSIAHTIGKPIAFVCNGQEYEDIVKFNADWMLERLFE